MGGEPRADVCLDDVERADVRGGEDRVDGAAEPESRELTAREELAGVGEQLGVGEHVEAFEEATLGMRIEIGGVGIGVRFAMAQRHRPVAKDGRLDVPLRGHGGSRKHRRDRLPKQRSGSRKRREVDQSKGAAEGLWETAGDCGGFGGDP